MHFYWLTLGVLSVWRVTHLLSAEDGAWNSIVRLRRMLGSGFWGELSDCFYCLSLWISAPVAGFLGENFRERILLWLALSGGAILLERFTNRAPAPPLPYWKEENVKQENPHVMLRTESARPDFDEITRH